MPAFWVGCNFRVIWDEIMILISEVELVLKNADIPYYRAKGYNIPNNEKVPQGWE